MKAEVGLNVKQLLPLAPLLFRFQQSVSRTKACSRFRSVFQEEVLLPPTVTHEQPHRYMLPR